MRIMKAWRLFICGVCGNRVWVPGYMSGCQCTNCGDRGMNRSEIDAHFTSEMRPMDNVIPWALKEVHELED